MKKTLYDALGVASTATPSFIELAHRHLRAELEPLAEQGVVDAKNRLASARIAHEILSDAVKRDTYDQRLRDEDDERAASASTQRQPATSRPGGLMPWVLAGLLALTTVTFYVQAQQARASAKALANAQADERVTLQRENDRLSAELDRVGNRATSLQASMEHNRNQAFERDATAVRRDIEAQRNRENQLAQQRETEERRRQQQAQDRVAQQDARNAQGERRYWACMNEALNRMPSDRANAQCARLR